MSKEKFNSLFQLIKTRQAFEKAHPYPPFSTHPTTINFSDIDNLKLIDYAINMGDINLVRYLMEQGATGTDFLFSALINNHLELAQFFLEQGEDCSTIKLTFITGNECRKWFTELIQQSLNNTESGIISFRSKQAKIYTAMQDSSFNEEVVTRFERAAEIGNIALIEQFKDDSIQQYQQYKLLIMARATENNQLELMQWLIENEVPVNPALPLENSFLNMAVLNQHQEAFDLLLAHGANVNYQNFYKRTILINAVCEDNLAFVDNIIKQNVNITSQDAYGKTALHYAAEHKNLAIIKKLLAFSRQPSFLDLKDIFGMRAIDYAQENQQQSIVVALAKHGACLPQKIAQKATQQSTIINRIQYYLMLNYRDLAFLREEGYCNGFSFLREYYGNKNKEYYFFDTLTLMGAWNGKKINQEFDDQVIQKKYYQSLRPLFEGWISDLTWFQMIPIEIFKLENGFDNLNKALNQLRLSYQYNMVGESEEEPPFLLSALYRKSSNASGFLEDFEIFHTRMPYFTRLRLGFLRHATSLHKTEENELSYYNSNFSRRTDCFGKAYDLVHHILYSNNISPEDSQNELLEYTIEYFYFYSPEKKQILDQHEVFSEAELPQYTQDIVEFKQRSPNGYTQLHVAVLSGAIHSVKKLLDCALLFDELFTVNNQGNTPLDLAFFGGNMAIIEILLDACKDNTVKFLPSYYHIENKAASYDLIIKKNLKFDLPHLFYKAILKRDYELLNRLLDKPLIDINSPLANKQNALALALQLRDKKMIAFLLQKGACFDPTSFLGFLIQSPELIDLFKPYLEINKIYPAGYSLLQYTIVHYAPLEDEVKFIRQLIALGANCNQLTQNNRTVLDLIFANWFDTKEQIALLTAILPFVQMNSYFQENLNDYLLNVAIHHNQLELTETLLNFTADINQMDPQGITPLIKAIYNKNLAIVDLLLARGANINHLSLGFRPLDFALYINDLNIFKLLLVRGAEIDLTCSLEQNVFLNTIKSGHGDMVIYLLAAKVPIDTVFSISAERFIVKAEDQHHQRLRCLFNAYNLKDRFCFTGLYWAIFTGQLEIIKILLDKNARLSNEPHSFSAFDLAFAIGRTDIYDLLYERLSPEAKIVEHKKMALRTLLITLDDTKRPQITMSKEATHAYYNLVKQSLRDVSVVDNKQSQTLIRQLCLRPNAKNSRFFKSPLDLNDNTLNAKNNEIAGFDI